MLLLPPPRIPPFASLLSAIPDLQPAGHRPASRERPCGPADFQCACAGRGPVARPKAQGCWSGYGTGLGACGPQRLLQIASPPPESCFWRWIRDPKRRSQEGVFGPDPLDPLPCSPLSARKLLAAPPHACAMRGSHVDWVKQDSEVYTWPDPHWGVGSGSCTKPGDHWEC